MSTDQQLHEPLLPTSAASAVENAASDVGRDTASATDDKDIAFPRWVLCRKAPAPRPRVNHNVFLSLLLAVIYGLADSLWTGTVIAAYLKRLGREKNGPVGNVEAVSGLASLFSALPVGYLADTCGRDKVIGAGGVLIIVTAVAHALLLGWIGTDEEALSHDDHKRELSFILFAAVMALWGIGGGVINGPSQALYADSTPAGSRSVYYMYLFAAYMIAARRIYYVDSVWRFVFFSNSNSARAPHTVQQIDLPFIDNELRFWGIALLEPSLQGGCAACTEHCHGGR